MPFTPSMFTDLVAQFGAVSMAPGRPCDSGLSEGLGFMMSVGAGIVAADQAEMLAMRACLHPKNGEKAGHRPPLPHRPGGNMHA